MIINDLDGYYIVFDTKNWNTELDTLVIYILISSILLSSRRTAFFLEPDAKVVDFSSASKGKRIQTEGEIPILSKTAAFLIILYQSFNIFLTHRIDIFRIFAS